MQHSQAYPGKAVPQLHERAQQLQLVAALSLEHSVPKETPQFNKPFKITPQDTELHTRSTQSQH